MAGLEKALRLLAPGVMSNQSPSANGRDQRGTDVSSREQNPPPQNERGLDERVKDVPPSPDIDKTEDPSKD